MKLTHSIYPLLQDTYEINIQCIDANSKSKKPVTYSFFVSPQEIRQVILEIECVANQFSFTRPIVSETNSSIYSQFKFFLTNPEKFKWFADFPQDSNTYRKNNLDIQIYEVVYYDQNKVKNKVAVSKLENFLDNFMKINFDFKIGDYFWDESATKKDYVDYGSKVNHLIARTILVENLEETLQAKPAKTLQSKI